MIKFTQYYSFYRVLTSDNKRYWVKKLCKKIWAGHVICIGETKNKYRSLFGKSERKTDNVKKLRVILKQIFEKQDMRGWQKKETSCGIV
jgi:hypothetical protein